MKPTTKKILIGTVIAGTAAAIIIPNIKIPKKPVTTPEEKKIVQLTTEQKLINEAMKRLKLTEDQLTIRGLLPSDFGLTTWDIAVAGAGYNSIVNTTIADGRFIAVTGVTYSNIWGAGNITGVQIQASGRLAEIWNLQAKSQQFLGPTFIDSTPTIVGENMPIQISLYALAAGAAEPIAFEGIVVEPKGMTTA